MSLVWLLRPPNTGSQAPLVQADFTPEVKLPLMLSCPVASQSQRSAGEGEANAFIVSCLNSPESCVMMNGEPDQEENWREMLLLSAAPLRHPASISTIPAVCEPAPKLALAVFGAA